MVRLIRIAVCEDCAQDDVKMIIRPYSEEKWGSMKVSIAAERIPRLKP